MTNISGDSEALDSWKLGNPWVGKITLKFLSCSDLFRPPVRLHFPMTSSGHQDSPEEKRLETRRHRLLLGLSPVH